MTKIWWNFNWAEFLWINANFSFEVSSYFDQSVNLFKWQINGIKSVDSNYRIKIFSNYEIFDESNSSIFIITDNLSDKKFKNTWISGHFRWWILKISWMNTRDITWIFRSYFSSVFNSWNKKFGILKYFWKCKFSNVVFLGF